MAPLRLWLLLLLAVLQPWRAASDALSGNDDGSEEWGYTTVRPGAHLFWWLYYSGASAPQGLSIDSAEGTRPLIMWLQGGPGASGVGYGNFEELGPLTVDLLPREYTWLKRAHLLFVDNPVGTGFSYVDDLELLTTNNAEIIADLITFLQTFFSNRPALAKTPFYVFCESYGGKYTSELAVAIHEAHSSGTLSVDFRGVAMGDSWISPIDFLKVWGPQLRTLALLDDYGEQKVTSYAEAAMDAINDGRWADAATLWAEQEEAIDLLTDHVDFYNVLRHNVDDVGSSSAYDSQLRAEFGRGGGWEVPHLEGHRAAAGRLARRHVARLHGSTLTAVMNGPIREKLGIVPANVSWGMSSGDVFMGLYGDFMKPTVKLVDRMLELGVNVTIFSGQLDLICCTDGTLNWMQRLTWEGMHEFFKAPRTPLYCPGEVTTGGFMKRHRHLTFFWIMNAGHMVPAENGCMALKMVEIVTGQDL